ncbi:MAG: chemotaxis protein CheA [Chitinispirillaceae bacterium]|nr:chemotaxis protein CheA [Chitinispirillaceae bacterium]
MSNSLSTVYEIVNGIAASLPLVDRTDISPLANTMQELEKINGFEDVPPALGTMAKRAMRLAELIILQETPFETGMKQLAEGIVHMEQALRGEVPAGDDAADGDTVTTDEPAPEPHVQAEASEPVAGSLDTQVDADLADLVGKFAQQLANALEDFETWILESEKGVPQAFVEMKRVLHTWKGEFGVLDMKQYVELIHDLEGNLESHQVTTDQLLQFKDLLAKSVEKLQRGIVPHIPDEIKTLILGTTGSEDGGSTQGTPVVQESAAANQETDDDAPLTADPALLADFVTESNDHIHRAETLLLQLEVDPGNMEHINTIFRACHTIKGVASFLSLKRLTRLAHATENLMDQIRKGKMELTPPRIDLLFESMDCLKEMVGAVAEALEGAPFKIPASYESIMERLEQCERIEGLLEVPTSDAAGKRVGELLVERGAASVTQVDNALKKQQDGDIRPIGEILIDQQVPPRMVGKALATQTMAKELKTTVEDTIRVPVKRLDQLIDMIGEGVIAQSMVYANDAVAGLKDLALEKKIAQSMLIMRQIQEMSMSLRMVALRSTFQKMARLVRDLSKKVSKEVEFVMEGEDTELDKSVVENIGDPLIHMLRNSLDHGIESTEERAAAGKTGKAKITLRAYHKAGNVCIEIEDDGRGLDRDKILRKAIERGLCKENDNPTNQEVFQYIFMPGFSTAAVVTDISGRGVGMDVVQRNITSLRGAIDIQSEKGKGTLFTIRLPLTLAIINGMIVRLNRERYIVPTLSILESILPKKEQIETVVGKGEVLKVRGELVRMIRLESLFFGSNGAAKKGVDGIALVVEDAMGRKVALFVDEIIDQQQVVIKNIGEGLGEIPGVAGGAIMSDGNISLILDIAGIVKIAAE